MKKKLLSMMLALSMGLTLLPGTAFAGRVTFDYDYVDGKWTVSGESGSYTVADDGSISITYTITLGSSIEIKADSNAEGKADMEALPDGLTDAQKNALGNVTVRSEDLGLLLQDKDIAGKLIEAGQEALEDAESAGGKSASVDVGLSIEITDAAFDKNDQVTSLALEITAVYTVTVDGKKPESSELTVKSPIKLTVAVPESLLANGANVSIEHSTDGINYHPHTVTDIDRTNNTVTFTSTDGLSPFRISSTQPSGGNGGSGGGSTGGTTGSGTTGGGSINNNTDDDDDIIIDEEDVPLASKPFLFEDVTENDWFYNHVKTAYEMGLMGGDNDTVFAPKREAKRSEVAQILYNLEGRPSIDGYDVTIPDVDSTDWFYNAAIWAYANGVFAGYPDGTFHGEEKIPRQQLMLVLYNYAEKKGYDLSAADDLSAFVDKDDTDSWALKGVQWAVGTGLVGGCGDGRLAPKDYTERAVLATILVGFANAYTDTDTDVA